MIFFGFWISWRWPSLKLISTFQVQVEYGSDGQNPQVSAAGAPFMPESCDEDWEEDLPAEVSSIYTLGSDRKNMRS